VPASPRIRTGRRAARSCSSARSASRIGAQRRERDAARLLHGRARQRTRDRRQQLLQADRLLEEIERADLGGVDRRLDRSVPRHHHHGHRELAAGRPLAQERHAIGVRHPDVEQHERGLLPLAIGTGFARVLGERDAIALVLQDLGQELADADFVVDDEQFFGEGHFFLTQAATAGVAPVARLGKTIVTRAPPSGVLAIAMRPPCSSTIFFTIARPSPVPFALVVT
jgi:hypothetical protein